jgi:GNAT superfamily N-acetyltransferase
MQIRDSVTDDTKSVIEMVQSSYKFSYRGYLPDEYLDNLSINQELLAKWLNYIQNHERYVAESQGKIVAFLMVDGDKKAKIFEICILYVSPDYQKKGIGSSMVDYICNIKKEQSYEKCKLWTIKKGPSVVFYVKNGFIATSEEKSWKFDIPIIKMIKELRK